MEYDLRQALPEGSGLSLREENTGNVWTGTVSHEIGRGGSCLVYRGVQRAFVGGLDRSIVDAQSSQSLSDHFLDLFAELVSNGAVQFDLQTCLLSRCNLD